MDLRPYQKEAATYCVIKKKSLLQLDVGLGKTAVCIEVAKQLAQMNKLRGAKDPKVLVICPAYLKSNWLAEIDLWEGEGIDWTIISYNYCSKLEKVCQLTDRKYDLLVCDEAHYLKSWGAKRTTHVVKELYPKCERVILSTATPYVRSAEDLHSLFSMCQPGEWGRLDSFRKRYCLRKVNPYGHSAFKQKWIWYGINPAHAQELWEKSRLFTFKKLKKDVVSDLPEKHVIDLDVKVKGCSLSTYDFRVVVDPDNGELEAEDYLSTACVELGLEKAKVAIEWMDSVPQNEKCVIFCKHRDVVKAVYEGIDREAYTITGETSARYRDAYIKDFWQGGCNTLICTIGACGVGVNLHCAAIGLFVELPWSYTELHQAEGRLHRLGMTDPVTIYRMISKGTVDDLIVSQINQKCDGMEISVGGLD